MDVCHTVVYMFMCVCVFQQKPAMFEDAPETIDKDKSMCIR